MYEFHVCHIFGLKSISNEWSVKSRFAEGDVFFLICRIGGNSRMASCWLFHPMNFKTMVDKCVTKTIINVIHDLIIL